MLQIIIVLLQLAFGHISDDEEEANGIEVHVPSASCCPGCGEEEEDIFRWIPGKGWAWMVGTIYER